MVKDCEVCSVPMEVSRSRTRMHPYCVPEHNRRVQLGVSEKRSILFPTEPGTIPSDQILRAIRTVERDSTVTREQVMDAVPRHGSQINISTEDLQDIVRREIAAALDAQKNPFPDSTPFE